MPLFISRYRNDTNLFLTANKHEIWLWDLKNSPHKIGAIDVHNIYSIIQDSIFLIISTYGNGVFIYKVSPKKVKKLFHFTTKEGLVSNIVMSSYIDKNRNLWLGTNRGITLFYLNVPFGIVDSRLINKKIILYSLKRIDTLLFIGSDSLYSYSFKFKKLHSYKFSSLSQFWDAVNINNRIYTARNAALSYILGDSIKNTNFRGENLWFIVNYPNTDYYFLGTSLWLYLVKIQNTTVNIIKRFDQINGDNRDWTIDKDKTFWILSKGLGVFAIKYDTLKNQFYIAKSYKSKFFRDNLPSRIFYSDKLNSLFLVIKGKIYRLDAKNDLLIRDKRFLRFFADIPVEYLGTDSLGGIWIVERAENNEVVNLLKPNNDGSLTKYIIYHGYSDVFYPIASNVVALKVWGGILFVSLNELNYINSFKFNPILTKVELPAFDSIIAVYTNAVKSVPQIRHKGNSLIFYFSSNSYFYSQYNEYSYKLENFDKKWSEWTKSDYKEYTNLPPGHYVFKLKTRNYFGKESPVVSYPFDILPPWYMTYWAFGVYIVLFVLFLYALNKFFTYNLKRRNEKLEQLIKERTREIEEKNKMLEQQKEEIELKNLELQRQKHEIELKNAELEQQKEEILTQAEELEAVNRELQKLSIIAQETDNAVILTDKDGNFIWVNPAFTKMFGYTFDELVHEISPNIISGKTDPEVRKQIEKCLNEKVTVEYDMKARNKYNKEIWVHVTLTPILDDEGNITALIAVDSDITELKKAQEQIKQQNENIKSSIRYALTIQKSILPEEKVLNDIFETFIIFRPKDIVSGDFYWLSNIYDLDKMPVKKFSVGTYFFFAVADCTGHGVPGAFMSLIGSRLLSEIVHEHKNHKPSSVLYEMDEKLKEILNRDTNKNPDGIVISLCRFDKIEESITPRINVTFAGAKSSLIYYKHKEDKFYKIRSSARQIGFVINENLEFFDQKFMLEKNDMIFMYSDGLKDLNSPERKSFGTHRIINIINEHKNLPMSEIKAHINEAINEWLKNDEQRDDITFIGFRIK